MAKTTIGVRPSTTTGSEGVAIDKIGDVNYPIYKEAFGKEDEVTLVSESNPLPTANTDLQKHSFARQEELLTSMLLELKILNRYMSVGYDIEITDNDIEE